MGAAFLAVPARPNATTAAPITDLPTTAMIMTSQPNCFGLGIREIGDWCGTGWIGGPVDIDGWDKVILRWSKDVDHRPEWRKSQVSERGYAKIVTLGRFVQARNGQLTAEFSVTVSLSLLGPCLSRPPGPYATVNAGALRCNHRSTASRFAQGATKARDVIVGAAQRSSRAATSAGNPPVAIGPQ
jgi:hypothetical protein